MVFFATMCLKFFGDSLKCLDTFAQRRCILRGASEAGMTFIFSDLKLRAVF